MGPGDVSDVPICISDTSSTPRNLNQVLSDDDLSTAVRTADLQQDIQICDVPLEVQVVDLRISVAPSAVRVVEQLPPVPSDDSQRIVCVVYLPSEVRMSDLPLGVGAVDLTPVVRAVDLPPVGHVENVPPAMPPQSRMSPSSPPVTVLEDSAVLLVPMTSNRVRSESSQDIRDEGPVFEVSPDSSFFFTCFPFPKDLDSYNDPVLGKPVAFALSAPVPGSDTPPMTYPVYMLPSGLALLPGQSSVQTVMASAVSSRQEGWSSGVPQTLDVSRAGPFDAYFSPNGYWG